MKKCEVVQEIRFILENNFKYKVDDIWVKDIFRICNSDDLLQYINEDIIYQATEYYMAHI